MNHLLLIKEFNDYYDFGTSFGVDNKVVYNRRREEYDLLATDATLPPKVVAIRDKIHSFGKSDYWGIPHSLSTRAYIGFCGVIYSIPKIALVGLPSIYIWGEDDIPQDVAKRKINRWMSSSRGKTVEEWASKNALIKTFECKEFFINNDLVSFAADGISITINPNLSSFGLQKVLPGLEAFQMLSMFLSEKSSMEEEYRAGSDIDIRTAKGFDNMSFKKRKSKPGR